RMNGPLEYVGQYRWFNPSFYPSLCRISMARRPHHREDPTMTLPKASRGGHRRFAIFGRYEWASVAEPRGSLHARPNGPTSTGTPKIDLRSSGRFAIFGRYE